MKKILLSVFLTIAASGMAQTVVTVDDIRYLIEDDHAVVARQDKELGGEVTIPASIEVGTDEYPVTELVQPTLQDNYAGGTVVVEGGAFQECQITSVELPASITVVSAGAFYGCGQLTGVKLPDGLLRIAPAAFARCTSLERIEIPGGVTSLERYAFGGCTSLKWVNIPGGVTELADGLFMDSGMEEFEIPVGITRIGEHALANTTLMSVTCGVRDARTIQCDATAFGDMTKVSLQIPRSGQEVYESYYPWCDFKSVSGFADDGETLVSDQHRAVIGGVRYLLYEAIAEGDNAREASASVDIQPVELEGDITIPEKVTYEGREYPVTSVQPTLWYYGSHMNDAPYYSYRGAFTGTKVTSVTLPSTVTTLGAFAFYRANSLKKVVLSSAMTTTGWCAMRECERLEEVTLPEGIAALTDGCFAYDPMLKTFVVPEGVTSIGGECFLGSGIEVLTIPSTCTSIGYQALELPALKTLNLNVEDVKRLDCTATAFGHDSEQAAARERLANVDLIVPLGSSQVYREYYPWIDFRSVSDVKCPYLELDGRVLSAPANVFTVDFPEGMADDEKFEVHGNGDYVQGLNLKEGVTVTFTTEASGSWVYVYLFNGNQNAVRLDGEVLNGTGDGEYRRCDRLVAAGTHTITCDTYEGNQWPCMFLLDVQDATADHRFEPDELTVRIDGVRYILDKGGLTATIARQNKTLSGDIVVPEKIEHEGHEYTVSGMVAPTFEMAQGDGGYRTTDGAFQDCQISSVSLPKTLNTIGVGAFNNCQQLRQVTLAEGIEVLGAASFANCTSLEEIYLPETITDLGSETDYGYWSYVFGGCTSLKKVNTPKLVTQLGQGCFKGSGIETFLIPENIKTLAPYCFASDQLKNIKICHKTLTAESITYTESNFADVSDIELIVPKGGTSLYKEFYPWKSFGTISEYTDQNDEHQYNAYRLDYEEETPAAARGGIDLTHRAASSSLTGTLDYTPSGVELTLPERITKNLYTYLATWKDKPENMPASDQVVKVVLELLGDLTGDKTLDTQDAISLIDKFLNGLNDETKRIADINGDGTVDTQDAMLVINIFLNSNTTE